MDKLIKTTDIIEKKLEKFLYRPPHLKTFCPCDSEGS